MGPLSGEVAPPLAGGGFFHGRCGHLPGTPNNTIPPVLSLRYRWGTGTGGKPAFDSAEADKRNPTDRLPSGWGTGVLRSV